MSFSRALSLVALGLCLTVACGPAEALDAEDGDAGSEMESSDDEGTDGTDGDGDACWPAADEPGDSSSESMMQTWGAACSSDAECVALIGEGGICMTDAIVYELPGGYCSKECRLPNSETTVVMNDPACSADGGVHCIGAYGFFERCVTGCEAASDCGRDGYFCRLMPLIAREGDPTVCMMDDCCEGGCGGG